MQPTVHLRFVKRRVGRNVVRILQQKWRAPSIAANAAEEWRDVGLADEEATTKDFRQEGD
jgi:hypothetical protein